VGTEVTGEKELNTNRQIIEDTLRSLFGDSSGKRDLTVGRVVQVELSA